MDEGAGMSVKARERAVLELRPSSGWKAVDVGELWEFRELLWTLTWRDLKVRYRQTVLGVIWIVGQPLLAILMLTFVFHRVARIQAPAGLPYPLFVLSGLVAWNFFSGAVLGAGNSLIGSTHLISKVYFPRLVVPLSAVLVLLVDLAVSGILLVVVMAVYGMAPDAGVALLPLGVLLAFMLSIGLGLWLSALNVEYRDVRLIVPFALQIWMFGTPVAYPVDAVPDSFRALLAANPMTGIVGAFRAGLPGPGPDAASLLVSAGFSVAILVSGAFYFRRMERRFADLL